MFKHPFYTRKGVVASESPLATTLGVKILEMGGNAVDASIAVSFALSVTHPHLGGLGGDYFALMMNTNGEVTFVNGSGYAPKALSIQLMKTFGYEQMPNFGPLSAVIPGMVDGLRILWEKYGSIKWKKNPKSRY